jgi:hypothetical protein
MGLSTKGGERLDSTSSNVIVGALLNGGGGDMELEGKPSCEYVKHRTDEKYLPHIAVDRELTYLFSEMACG